MRLGAVVGCGRVGDDLLQVGVVVAVGMLQVHSVCIVVPPARLLRVIHRLQEKETGGLRQTDFHWNMIKSQQWQVTKEMYSNTLLKVSNCLQTQEITGNDPCL